jgi:hypothetical protein
MFLAVGNIYQTRGGMHYVCDRSSHIKTGNTARTIFLMRPVRKGVPDQWLFADGHWFDGGRIESDVDAVKLAKFGDGAT